MASTNKTTNYNLSQYIGSDKPTYLGDYNSDMSKIDEAIKSVADTITISEGELELINSKIGNLTNLTTETKNNLVGAINEVESDVNISDAKIGSLSSLTTLNKGNIVNAINEVDGNIKKFDLNVIKRYNTVSGITATGCTVQEIDLTLATNEDDSIFKIYGHISIIPNSTQVRINLPSTGLEISENYSIEPVGLAMKVDSSSGSNFCYANMSNNNIEIGYYAGANRQSIVLVSTPVLYFNKSFGDTPSA